MFNNRFTQKDPLVEAVQNAQREGQIRRQAEALVNEAFDVYSRKAVVNEQVAAYDATVEEVIVALKEGVQIDEIKASWEKEGSWSKMMKKQERDFFKNKKAAEKRKAAKADKDYDKDGKVESPKDEVWGSRLKAAKEAGRLDELSDDLIKRYHRKAVDKFHTGEETPERREKGRRMATEKRFGGIMGIKRAKVPATGIKEEAEQIDEVSKRTLGSYIKKASHDVATKSAMTRGAAMKSDEARKNQDYMGAKKHDEFSNKMFDKSWKRRKGIAKAVDKLTNEEHIDEEKMKVTVRSGGTVPRGLVSKPQSDRKPYSQWSDEEKKRHQEYTDSVVSGIRRNRKLEEDNLEEAPLARKKSLAKGLLARIAQRKAMKEEAEQIDEFALGSAAGAAGIAAKNAMRPATTPRKAVSSLSAPVKSLSSTSSTGTNSKGYFSGSPNVSKGDYTVKSGENLSGIAKRLGTSVGAIQSMNKGMTDVNKISAGAKLNLPTTSASKPATSGISPVAKPADTSGTQKWANPGAKTSDEITADNLNHSGAAKDVAKVSTTTSSNDISKSDIPKIDKGPAASTPTGPTWKPDEKKQASQSQVTATENKLNESVQVGDRTYRII